MNGAENHFKKHILQKYSLKKKGKGMTIKEVEKLTGLTAKSIRYYEAKGLLKVERNEENSYRNYSENEINRLKQIKLFRYLDFSIEEIKQLLEKEEGQIREALTDKAEAFSEQKSVCEDKRNLCLTLARDYKTNPQIIDEYNDTIEFLESDEMAETIEKLKDLGCPNLSGTIICSLIYAGPIFWLFYNIANGMYSILMVNAILALIGTMLITANWIRYVRQYRQHKKRVKKSNREWAWMPPLLIFACIFGIGAIVVVMLLAEKIIAPEDYLFYQYQPTAETIMVWLIIIPVILLCVLLVAKLRKKRPEQMEDMNDILYIWNHIGKWRPVAIALWGVGMYCCITSVTYVTEESIIYHSPIHPEGIVYEYSDVEEIVTGFGNKIFSIAEYKKKGNFFYQIRLDGRKITFHVPNTNEKIERYTEDSYLELEEFDQTLVAMGISKRADDNGYENCDLDKRYVERFLRIIRLK